MICTECGLGDEELPNLVEECDVDICPHQKRPLSPHDVGMTAEAAAIGRSLAAATDIDFRGHDPVNHPPHYMMGGIEAVDVIEAYGLDFLTGNVIKYVLRHRFKGHPLEDLRKARWYLDRRISDMEKTDESGSD